jgi:hypothetical protein
MSIYTKKGAVQFEPPPKRCSFQEAVATFSAVANLKAEHNSRKNAQASQKSPEKIKQYFGSSRGYGNFCQIGHRLNFKPIFRIIESHALL